MSRVRNYKKWGMPHSIIGFICGILSLLYSIAFMITMSITSGGSFAVPQNSITSIAIIMSVTIAPFIFFGILFSIIGLAGWSKKGFSVVGLIFSLIPILLVAVGLLIALT